MFSIRPNRTPVFYASLLLLLIVFLSISGCRIFNPFGGESEKVSPAISEGPSRVSFRFVFPGAGISQNHAPSVMPNAVGMGAQVMFRLLILNPGNSAQPFVVLSRILTVTSGETATFSFPSLPSKPVIGQVRINGGNLQGWTDFHGALDLLPGVNTLEVAPCGSHLIQDLAAHCAEAVSQSAALMDSAPAFLVSFILGAIRGVDPSSPSAYREAFKAVTLAILPAATVKLEAGTPSSSLVGTRAGITLWNLAPNAFFPEITYLESARSDFSVSGILRHSVDQTGLAVWGNSAGSVQVLSRPDPATGTAFGTCAAPGTIEQALVLKDGSIVAGGFHSEKACPILFRWNGTGSALLAHGTAAATGLTWEHAFASQAASAGIPKPSVESISYDGVDTILVTVRDPATTLPRFFRVDPGTGGAFDPASQTIPNFFPSVTLTDPASETVFPPGAAITIVATASDPDGTITKVDFFAGSQVIGTDNSAPWSVQWSTPTVGLHVLSARATDNRGAVSVSEGIRTAVSPAVNSTASPPALASSNPASGAVDVATRTALSITFDRPVKPETFSAGLFDSTFRRTPFVGTFTFQPDLQTVVFSSDLPLAWHTTYFFQVSASLSSLSGATMPGDIVLSFTTAPRPIIGGTAKELLITEVGSCLISEGSPWLEVFNNSNAQIQLSDYTLRSGASLRLSPYTFVATKTFPLPQMALGPGEFALIRGMGKDDYSSGTGIAMIPPDANFIPFWTDEGFLELGRNGQTVDFLRFGNDLTTPISPDAWVGTSAAAFPLRSENDYGVSLCRSSLLGDSNTAGDWVLREFATPGGPNDVTSDLDSDGDGIPDCSELPGSTFAGLPLYFWGARQGKLDIFIHLDRMESTDPGLIPRREAIEKIVGIFGGKGIAVHFDTGTLYGTTPTDHCLDGGTHLVPFSTAATIGNSAGKENLYRLKNLSMPLQKRQVFHYCLMAFSQNVDGTPDLSGLGEIFGNDFLISLGNRGLNDSTPEDRNFLVNLQAAGIMHELGHNLGLLHGGDEDQNYKPNYLSIMNYMYTYLGLPEIGNALEGDRYYWYQYTLASGPLGFATYFTKTGTPRDLHQGPYSDPASFRLDFSDGKGEYFDETRINEMTGLGRFGSTWVDFDGDHVARSTPYSMDVNKVPADQAGYGGLADFDDWTAIKLNFQKYLEGDASAPPIPRRSRAKRARTGRHDFITDDSQPLSEDHFPFTKEGW